MLKHLELSKESMGVNVVPSRLLSNVIKAKVGVIVENVPSRLDHARKRGVSVLTKVRRQDLYPSVSSIVNLLALVSTQSPESYGWAGESSQTGCADGQRPSLPSLLKQELESEICLQLDSHDQKTTEARLSPTLNFNACSFDHYHYPVQPAVAVAKPVGQRGYGVIKGNIMLLYIII